MRDYRGYSIGETVHFIRESCDGGIQKGKIKEFVAREDGYFYVISCGKENITLPEHLVDSEKLCLYDYMIRQKEVCRDRERREAVKAIDEKYDNIINEIRLRQKKECGLTVMM